MRCNGYNPALLCAALSVCDRNYPSSQELGLPDQDFRNFAHLSAGAQQVKPLGGQMIGDE